jgi:hypothetical protein
MKNCPCIEKYKVLINANKSAAACFTIGRLPAPDQENSALSGMAAPI